ncbi:ABC transporter permease [Rhizobium laguerreae]|uniref:ABC transporter permease n=1 Tax=Rhizobium laguerreae TaxID=1076926 RepID=UPI001C916206|nr:ABC transporter permease [Rhizobium laguerreae]MBY3381831.1 ABC transporter permease [Rhizobium laguerreae]
MLRAYTSLYIAFLFAPIVLIILFSLHSSPALVFPFEGLSTRWYVEIVNDPQFRASFWNSIIVASATAVTTTVIGSFAALALTRLPRRTKQAFSFLNFAPITLPGLFIGIALLVLFSQMGMHRSLVTITIAHVVFCLPFFVEAVRSRVEYFDTTLEEAARDLGASAATAFKKVTLPIIAPTLIGGALLVFALSFDELVITVFVSGNETTLPVYMLSMMRRTVNPTINAASVISLGLSIAAIGFGGLLFLLQRRRALTNRNLLSDD